MTSIELMVEEHKNIVRMLNVVRAASYRILQGENINYEDFNKMIDFIKNYADAHHHGKEEKFLFKEMVENLGKVGEKLINNGMLVEHDWGRLFVSELIIALDKVQNGDEYSKIDVIANAVGYANHLARHIKKEDELVYTFAEKNLNPEILTCVNLQSDKYEEDAEKKGIQKYYIELLETLEAKYMAGN